MAKKSKKKPPPVRVALIGTGGMANMHAERFQVVEGCSLVAACDIDAARVKAFAEKHGIPRTFTDPLEVFKDPAVDAVSIVTPDAFHAPLAIAALKARKHVLCEKPLALNHGDAKKMLAAARRSGVIHMVNLSYRDWPAIQAVAEVVRAGGIGDLRHIEASYLQAWLVSTSWGDWRTSPGWLWRLSSKHGSNGVLGDVGVHIIDFALFPAGPVKKVYCQLKAFPKAKGNRIGDYILDANDSALLNVTFKNGALGTIHTTRWCGGHANRLFLRLSGTLGSIEVDSDRSTRAYRICAGKDLEKNTWKEVEAPPTPNNYARFIRAIQTGVPDEPSFVPGVEAQKVIDACFRSAEQDAPVTVR